MSARRLFLALTLGGILAMPTASFCDNSGASRGAADHAAHASNEDYPRPAVGASRSPGASEADGATEGDAQEGVSSDRDMQAPSDTASRQAGRASLTGRSRINRPSQDPYAAMGNRERSARSAVLDTAEPAAVDRTTDVGASRLGRGLNVRVLNDSERHDLNITSGGLRVTDVGQGTAEQAGLRAGDVVLSLDGVAITSTAQFCKLLRQLPHDRPVPVLVRRTDNNLFLPLRAPER